jgi:O-antigen/teichoic acid export membrane protein
LSPFRNILKLSVGDFIAKAAYFAAFVYMAKRLGVANYGVLEFAIAIRTYLLLLADGGLELWAVRESAKGVDVHRLVAIVAPVRLMLAALAFLSMNGILAIVPENPNLRQILPLLGLTVFLQGFNLKWIFMGQERMIRVALGLVISQFVFAAMVFLLVHRPTDLIWVPVAFLASEFIIVVYFGHLFIKLYGKPRMAFSFDGLRSMLRPALTLGASHGLALLNYNLDSILIGILMGPGPVGWYAAAYKPITAGLALPVSYFLGLFPNLSRNYNENREAFRSVLLRSIRLTAIFAIPLGLIGTFLAGPVIAFLFGGHYTRSVPALQLLSWSAVLVTLRGNFRQGLNAAGKQRLDLACAGSAVFINLILNLVLIPRYSIYGAAAATVASEIVWFGLAGYLFSRQVMPLNIQTVLWRPVLAATFMGMSFLLTSQVFWITRAGIAGIVYFGVLAILGESEILSKLPFRRRPLPQTASEDVRPARAGIL